MVQVIGYQLVEKKGREDFLLLVLQGGIEAVKSETTGKMYFTARTVKVPATFDEETCKSIIGSQSNIVVKDYHNDVHFSKRDDNTINFWNLYNLFTEANKNTYIDSNFERNVNAFEFINYLIKCIINQQPNYFIY